MNGKDGGPAFPRSLPDIKVPPDEAFEIVKAHSGMSLRDWFAATIDIPIAVVMDGLDRNGFPSPHSVGVVSAYRAKLRYCEADAMLEVRQLTVTNTEAS